jgi:hypothetical protein
MPLAVKNNALIVKDGKLAENCDCCGGWYCDVPDNVCFCVCGDSTKTLPNILLFTCSAPNWSTYFPEGDIRRTWPSPDTGGPVTLTRQVSGDFFGATGCQAQTWLGTYGDGITVHVIAGGVRWLGPLGVAQIYANDFVLSSGRFGTSNPGLFVEDMCNGLTDQGLPYGFLSYSVQRGD